METARASDPTIEQKRLFYHLLLTLVVAGAVASLLHKPIYMFMIVSTSWMLSVFSLGRDGYLAITRSVIAMAVVMYLFGRFVSPLVGGL